MHITRLNWINTGIIAAAVLLVLLSLFFKVIRPSSIEVIEKVSEKPTLPKGGFSLTKEQYEVIGPPFLSLKFSAMALQVPDLKKYLVYYGKNDRPDADPLKQTLFFGFNGVKGVVAAPIKEPTYIVYDKNDPKGKYKFSPGNAVTTLWIEASPGSAGEVAVSAAMRNEAGEVVHDPISNSEFTLKERPQIRTEVEERKLGDVKLDGMLLSRQGAKWYGIDKFIEKHGGEEYKDRLSKQRIDFGTGDDTYSVYIGPDSVLAWKDGRWREITPGKESEKFPILDVNKTEDRLMKLDFWDVDGKGKLSLNMIKSMDTWTPDTLQKEFNFIGARTRSQFLFEMNKERMTVSPLDWLLRTEKGWKKLTTAQDIDDYVERKISGPLFVFDGVEKKDGRQILEGTLFSKSRTEMKTIEIPMQQGTPVVEPKKEKKGSVSKGQQEEAPDVVNEEEEIDMPFPEELSPKDPAEAERIKEKMMEKLKEQRQEKQEMKDLQIRPGVIRP
jgi:hypothetical protein